MRKTLMGQVCENDFKSSQKITEMTNKQKKYIRDMRIEGKGYNTIANALFLSRDSVRDYCKRNGLAGNGAVVHLNAEFDVKNHRVCKRCGKTLLHVPGKRKKTFCSDYCRKQYWRENHD